MFRSSTQYFIAWILLIVDIYHESDLSGLVVWLFASFDEIRPELRVTYRPKLSKFRPDWDLSPAVHYWGSLTGPDQNNFRQLFELRHSLIPEASRWHRKWSQEGRLFVGPKGLMSNVFHSIWLTGGLASGANVEKNVSCKCPNITLTELTSLWWSLSLSCPYIMFFGGD